MTRNAIHVEALASATELYKIFSFLYLIPYVQMDAFSPTR